MRRLVIPALQLMAWLLLWGDVSVGNLLTGVVAVGLVNAMVPMPAPSHRLHPVGIVKLLSIFVVRLWQSSVTVAVAVLAPTPARLRTGIVEFELETDSTLVATIIADAISLTPGTLTLDVLSSPPRLAVHVMGLGDENEVLDDLRVLERLVLAAVEPLVNPVRHQEAAS